MEQMEQMKQLLVQMVTYIALSFVLSLHKDEGSFGYKDPLKYRLYELDWLGLGLDFNTKEISRKKFEIRRILAPEKQPSEGQTVFFTSTKENEKLR